MSKLARQSVPPKRESTGPMRDLMRRDLATILTALDSADGRCRKSNCTPKGRVRSASGEEKPVLSGRSANPARGQYHVTKRRLSESRGKHL